VVENPTDEDWKDVRMALISGRPISFQMDLYQPLYVSRPTVVPELFASLQPRTYTGNIDAGKNAISVDDVESAIKRLKEKAMDNESPKKPANPEPNDSSFLTGGER